MNIGYLLFMGLLCSTLALWALVALRDDHSGARGENGEGPEEGATEKADASDPGGEDTGVAATHDEE